MTKEEVEALLAKFYEASKKEFSGDALRAGVEAVAAAVRAQDAARGGTSEPTCEHHEARFGCNSCGRKVRAKHPEFPLQVSRGSHGPVSVPWVVAERSWATYSGRYGREQSVERLAQRGGFGWAEMDDLFPGWREATDAWRKLETENAAQGRTIAALTQERDALLGHHIRADEREWAGDPAVAWRAYHQQVEKASRAEDEVTRLGKLLAARLESENAAEAALADVAEVLLGERGAGVNAQTTLEAARKLERENRQLSGQMRAVSGALALEEGDTAKDCAERVVGERDAARSTIAALTEKVRGLRNTLRAVESNLGPGAGTPPVRVRDLASALAALWQAAQDARVAWVKGENTAQAMTSLQVAIDATPSEHPDTATLRTEREKAASAVLAALGDSGPSGGGEGDFKTCYEGGPHEPVADEPGRCVYGEHDMDGRPLDCMPSALVQSTPSDVSETAPTPEEDWRTVETLLGALVSATKSGEEWSRTLAEHRDRAKAAIARLKAAPNRAAEAMRDRCAAYVDAVAKEGRDDGQREVAKLLAMGIRTIPL